MGFTLNYAPPVGTTLTVVKNTGLNLIGGTFKNLAQGQDVTLSFGGTAYHFVANYFGGTGNDLVLQWADVRPAAWGLGTSGQLGNNGFVNSLVPGPVNTLAADGSALANRTILALSVGGGFSVALCSDGRMISWGANDSGQLGDNTFSTNPLPVEVETEAGLLVLSGKTVAAVTSGSFHNLALCSDGTLAAWGLNTNGRLGDGGTTASAIPVAVDRTGVLATRTVVAVSAGGSHSLALCSDGAVAAWGANGSGQLGDNSTTDRLVPVLVNTASGVSALFGKSVIAVSAGGNFSAVLCSDGTVATWGDNTNGSLGNGSFPTPSSVPVAVSQGGNLAGKTVVAVSAGTLHCMVLCSDGTVAGWGRNNGRLGNGSNVNVVAVPVLTTTLSGTALFGKTVVTVSAGNSHSMALCSDGTAAAWGTNGSGQLGNGGSSSTVPVAVSTASLAAGERFVVDSTRQGATHNLALIAMPPGIPQINVEQPVSNSLTDGSATPINFGNVGPALSNSLVFTIVNPGTWKLAIQLADITFTGSNAADFSVTANPAASVPPAYSTTFTVRFSPAAAGARSAAMHIASNVTGSANPFDIALTGTGLTEQEYWRQIYFGSPANTGIGADTADPDADGNNNSQEFIAGLNPLDPSSRIRVRIEAVPGEPGQKAIVFSPRLGDRTYTVTAKSSLLFVAPWSAITTTPPSDYGAERMLIDLDAGEAMKFSHVEITKP